MGKDHQEGGNPSIVVSSPVNSPTGIVDPIRKASRLIPLSNTNTTTTYTPSIVHSDPQHNNIEIKKELAYKRRKVFVWSLLLGFVMATIAICLVLPIVVVVIHYLEQQRRDGYVERVRQIAITAELLIRKQIEVSFGSLQILTNVAVEWNYTLDWDRFNRLGARLAKDFPEIDTFEYALTDYVTLQYIYPLAGLEFMIGHHMGTNT